MKNIQELSQSTNGPFEVVGHIGGLGQKTWHLRQMQSGQEFKVKPTTAADWPKVKKPPKGPSIILSTHGSTMVGMHLETGSVFAGRIPPTGLKL